MCLTYLVCFKIPTVYREEPFVTFIWEGTFLLSVLFPPLAGLYLIGAVFFHSQTELSLEVNYIFYFLAAYACFFNKTYKEIIIPKWPWSQKTSR